MCILYYLIVKTPTTLGYLDKRQHCNQPLLFLTKPPQVAQLQSLLKPHMLRRMKKDVPDLDIPDKRELVVPIELSREQKEVYRAILTKNMDVLRKVCMVVPTAVGTGTGSKGKRACGTI